MDDFRSFGRWEHEHHRGATRDAGWSSRYYGKIMHSAPEKDACVLVVSITVGIVEHGRGERVFRSLKEENRRRGRENEYHRRWRLPVL